VITDSGFIIVSVPTQYSNVLIVTSFTQNSDATVTLSGQALAGVAITSQSVSLSGDLVLDVSALDVYDGMTFTLINASSISGAWNQVDVVGTFTECNQVSVTVDYTQSSAVATLNAFSLCFASIESIVLGIALV
jgi:hypothetical protein